MNDWPDYELLDFGEGRKLESFGGWVVDRPAPAAACITRMRPRDWTAAMARFNGEQATAGKWSSSTGLIVGADIAMLVQLANGAAYQMDIEALPSGQVGVFPEQWACWNWIAAQCARAIAQSGGAAVAGSRLRVLNLFAYTGGSTLAAAVGGAEVVHVDAAKSVVERARQNATASGLAEHPIRWIVEDALKFCRREVKRGNHYDAVILDPPTYGHGPKGEEWSIRRDLLPLLELCGELTERRPMFVLATCHTPGIGPADLSAYLADGVFGHCGQPPRTGELTLETADGRRLSSGVFARWPG